MLLAGGIALVSLLLAVGLALLLARGCEGGERAGEWGGETGGVAQTGEPGVEGAGPGLPSDAGGPKGGGSEPVAAAGPDEGGPSEPEGSPVPPPDVDEADVGEGGEAASDGAETEDADPESGSGAVPAGAPSPDEAPAPPEEEPPVVFHDHEAAGAGAPEAPARKRVPRRRPAPYVPNPAAGLLRAGTGSGHAGVGGGQQGGATFYGVGARGQRFIYVVDRSTSMSGQNLERAKQELLKSVGGLNDQQRFYVFFYDTETTPMAYGDFARASLRNKNALKEWVESISAQGGTDPEESMLRAIEMGPDAIFLLSDGAFSPAIVEKIRETQARRTLKVRIYTIGVGAGAAAHLLRQIAEQNGGQYRAVNGHGRRGARRFP